MNRLILKSFLAIIFLTSCSKLKKSDQFEQLELKAIENYLSDINEYLYHGTNERLFKIQIDIDGDNIKDLMLSGYYKGGWGNAGGEWTIYHNDGSKLRECFNKILMYPSVARFNLENSSILTYNRLGCCDGHINQVQIVNCKVERQLLEEYKNDNQIGEKIKDKFEGLAEFHVQAVIINNAKNLNDLKWEEWK